MDLIIQNRGTYIQICISIDFISNSLVTLFYLGSIFVVMSISQQL